MITIKENQIIQELPGMDYTWTVTDLLTSCRPLSDEPLSTRMKTMQDEVLAMAESVFTELPENALLCYHFWKQLRPDRIETQKYKYSVSAESETPEWELTINSKGLFYKDLSAMYCQQAGEVQEQLFSDFWFFGPEKPIPDLSIRQKVVAQIRNAFLQIGPVAQQHFQLFEYPKLRKERHWQEGDHKRKDYVTLRPFGIEISAENWHDGLMYNDFISFERMLTNGKQLERFISPDIQKAIREHLSVKDKVTVREEPDPQKAAMRQIYLENGGMSHHIAREHGDSYSASPIDELIWKRELIDDLKQRLEKIDHYSGLLFIAQVMQYHGVPDAEELFIKAANKPNLKARQAIAQILKEQFHSEAAADIIHSMREYKDEDNYWWDHAFSSYGRMRDNKAVQNFIIQCLRGKDERHFKRAVDVLVMWGVKGDVALTDRPLLLSLNWNDAIAQRPEFMASLDTVIKIIEGKKSKN
ncbi:MAG: hypothetical protein R3A50_07105 [Saprospiraceae bacterium]